MSTCLGKINDLPSSRLHDWTTKAMLQTGHFGSACLLLRLQSGHASCHKAPICLMYMLLLCRREIVNHSNLCHPQVIQFKEVRHCFRCLRASIRLGPEVIAAAISGTALLGPVWRLGPRLCMHTLDRRQRGCNINGCLEAVEQCRLSSDFAYKSMQPQRDLQGIKQSHAVIQYSLQQMVETSFRMLSSAPPERCLDCARLTPTGSLQTRTAPYISGWEHCEYPLWGSGDPSEVTHLCCRYGDYTT